MIKDNQQYFNKLHVLIDALVIIVSYVFAWWLKFLSGILDHEVGVLSFEFYMRALLLIVPVYILLYYAFNLYTSKRVQGRRLEFSALFHRCRLRFRVSAAPVRMFQTIFSPRQDLFLWSLC